jgi:hypothetical protein
MGVGPATAVQAYVEERLKQASTRALAMPSVCNAGRGTTVRRFAALAAQQRLFLHAHVDDGTVEKLLHLYPQVRIRGPCWDVGSRGTVERLLEHSANPG